ncbi:MAG: secretin N-terminal domain-containing protein [Acidobacteriota bacterium]
MLHPSSNPSTAARTALLTAVLCLAWFSAAMPAAAQPAAPADEARLSTHAFSLEHREVGEALNLVRPLLSSRGSVEEQRRGNTLVVRDRAASIERIAEALSAFDVPPKNMRLEIQVVQAGPKRKSVVSPPLPTVGAELPEDLEERLKALLTYEDYKVLAQADVPSFEGQPVTHSVGDDYEVSFKLGQVVGDQRLRLEGFKVKKRVRSTNKGRRLEPRELYHATFNLWLEKPFMLVLTQNAERREALLIAISARHGEPSADEAAGSQTPNER